MSSSPFEEPASPISEDSDTGIDESYILQMQQHAQQEPASPRGFGSPFGFLKEASSASASASGSGGGSGGKRRMPLSGWFGGPGARDTKSRRREERESVGMGKRGHGHGQGAGGQGGWPSSELAGAGRAREELLDHAQVERIRSGESWGDPFDDTALKARS
ncbi:hypothetical protein EIP86_006508 [Pleurotus ostreatoroseus]|nr:hypothetical protein EIP86_006508 [Pleurotus ostreatoroseus]